MAKIDAAKVWALHHRMQGSVLAAIEPDVRALGIELKELFLLAAVDEHPYPAALAQQLFMPRPTVTVTVKRLEAERFLTRKIDPGDLRRHRLSLTASGRRAMTRGLAILEKEFSARVSRLTASQQAELAKLLEALA